MAIVTYRPLNAELRPFLRGNYSPLSRLMDEFFSEFRPGETTVWGPNVDVVENPEAFEIHAELPGVRPEDVKITFDNNVLTLSGEKKQELKEDRDQLHRVERSYGRFERSFSLPTTVRADGVRAQFEDGILRVILPKAEEARSRTIQIEPTRK